MERGRELLKARLRQRGCAGPLQARWRLPAPTQSGQTRTQARPGSRRIELPIQRAQWSPNGSSATPLRPAARLPQNRFALALTVAGGLPSHLADSSHLPRSSVKIYRYTTSNAEGSREHLAYDPISIDGAVASQVAAAVIETVRQVEEIPTLDAEGLIKIKYPEETLHEIITTQ